MDTLRHTPAHVTSYPDRFEDDVTGQAYSVAQDTDAEDPRDRTEDEHAALWAYREPALSHSSAAQRPKNWIIDVFAAFYAHVGADKALRLTERWLRVFHPDQRYDLAVRTIRGYTQSDWLDVIAVVTEGYGTAESHIDEFRMWAFGDVWTVIPDTGAGISDIYADSPEEALAYFRENFEDEHDAPSAVYDRHGGPWGSDETCADCTDEHGQARSEPGHYGLDPLEPAHGTESYQLTWQIDQDGPSPAEAAVRVWQDIFSRGPFQPNAEDACVFEITDAAGRRISIDLSDDRYAHLFTR